MTIEHYKSTLLKKPVALSGSLAFEQMNDKLKNIFVNHYKGLDAVFNAINELEERSITINTEK